MTKILVDVDDEALAEAMEALGTKTKKDTVNTALREVSLRKRRALALEDARQLVAEGGIDLDVMASQWRSHRS